MKKTLVCILAAATVYGAMGQQAAHRTKVIAHRGYWDTEGSAQNSLASLRKAAEIGCYGSEFDVHLTSDGVAIINHDNDWAGAVIQHNTYSVFEKLTLANGETIPTLEQYLTEGAKYPRMKLILEIKSADSPEHESRAVEAIMDMVEKMGLREQVEYIAFSYHVCKEVVARDPDAVVAYLNGDKTPEELKADGIRGLDYNLSIARRDPGLFDAARAAGITTNIWTVNREDDMRYIIEHGVDFITTDNPELAQKIIAETE
ncbi:MAG: glycerophosphodiester phosphodiesterase [Alistipes sp.]|nr:glycerophosphodiester phosphodiesterase [Alistipes sp.]